MRQDLIIKRELHLARNIIEVKLEYEAVFKPSSTHHKNALSTTITVTLKHAFETWVDKQINHECETAHVSGTFV